MIWMVVGLAYIALIAVWLGNYYKSKRLERACVEAAHGGYLGALDYIRKRLCPWCKLGVGVAKTRHAGPWKHGAAKNEACRASWVINYEWEYREAARKLKEQP